MSNRKVILPLILCLSLTACETMGIPADTFAVPSGMFDFSTDVFSFVKDEKMSDSLSDQGKAMLADGKTTEAIDVYESSIARDDSNSRAWNGLGAAYDLLGKKEKAKEAFSRAHELDPFNTAIVNNLAHVNLELGDAKAAVELLSPYAKEKDAPDQVKENLKLALDAQAQADSNGLFANLGSYATEGMANGKAAMAKELIGETEEPLSIKVSIEVKIAGGIPTFNVRAMGKNANSACEKLKAEAFPCFMSR